MSWAYCEPKSSTSTRSEAKLESAAKVDGFSVVVGIELWCTAGKSAIIWLVVKGGQWRVVSGCERAYALKGRDRKAFVNKYEAQTARHRLG